MTSNTVFALRKGEMLTLASAATKGLHGEFVAQENSSWMIRMLPTQMKKLAGNGQYSLSFVRGQLLYMGTTELLNSDRDSCLCSFSYPQDLSSRPMRRLPRINSDIAAALIYTDKHSPNGRRQFSTRDQNRILDLTTHGAKIVCKQPLESADGEVILVTCFDTNPNLANAQVYYHAEIVRRINERPLEDFPFAYGVAFKPLVAECEQALENYLSEIIGEPSYLKEA